MTVTASIVLSH